ncbi:MAG: hypothetical protein IKY67_05810 [Paludibacteraceae bacterium]|nr:hypothetical protein [Paludibacteraceae bacterium]
MKQNGIVVEYGDITPNAKENFEPSSNEQAEFSKIEQLKEYNITFPNYGNPCEYGVVPLDNSIRPLDKSGNIGYYSESVTDETGRFAEPIALIFQSSGLYSSSGLALTFDDVNGIFSTEVHIDWYRNGQIIEQETFYPDNAQYFCEKNVSSYNMFIVIFYKMNMPYNRLKIKAIEYGQGLFFYGDELKNVSIQQQIDPLSSSISINTCDLQLEVKKAREFNFQENQPIKTWFNGELRSTTFVKDAKRNGEKSWSLKTEDYIGLLEDVTFLGGMYGNPIWLAGGNPPSSVDMTAGQLLQEIFEQASVPFEIEDDIYSIPINGHLPVSSARDAISQICFAIGAICDTSNSDKVKVYKLKDVVTQKIPLNRIQQGQNFDTIQPATSVEVTTLAYSVELATDVPVVYDTTKGDPTGENMLIVFTEPKATLSIRNVNGNDYIQGRIIKRGINYVIADVGNGDYIQGENLITFPYRTEIRKNHNAPANAKENTIKITESTLIDTNNVDDVADRCFDYYSKARKTNLKIVEGKRAIRFGEAKYGEFKFGQSIADKVVNIGDKIIAETQYLGDLTGTIISQKYTLNGNILVKDSVMI